MLSPSLRSVLQLHTDIGFGICQSQPKDISLNKVSLTVEHSSIALMPVYQSNELVVVVVTKSLFSTVFRTTLMAAEGIIEKQAFQ